MAPSVQHAAPTPRLGVGPVKAPAKALTFSNPCSRSYGEGQAIHHVHADHQVRSQRGLGTWSPGISRAIMAAVVTAAFAACSLSVAPPVSAQSDSSLGELLVGKAAFGDWHTDAPLVRRKITELPPPYATRSASNPPRVIGKPVSAAPKVPPGFQVELFVSNLRDPRMVRVAPNGDIFVAESEPGRIRVLRADGGAAKPHSNDVFAVGLDQPFGIAFYPPGSDPQWIYISPIRDL
jgi:hypothetical protein